MEKHIAIFDIDSCIADDSWRLQFIKSDGTNRFDDYHSMCASDSVLCAGDLQLNHHIRERHSIIFLTARPESVRENTKWWLENKFPGLKSSHWLLIMRHESQEGVGSVKLKHDMLLETANPKQIIAAYDDRPDVVKMYLDAGISGALILDSNGLQRYEGQETTLGYIEREFVAEALEKSVADYNFYPKFHPTSKLGFKMETIQPKASAAGSVACKSAADILKDIEWAKNEVKSQAAKRTAADILEEAGRTFRERNAVYKDNAEVVGQVMKSLFPNGVKLRTAEDHKMYHLFELVIVKLTRFTQSGLTHTDSIHDLAVYAAMCQNLAATHKIDFT